MVQHVRKERGVPSAVPNIVIGGSYGVCTLQSSLFMVLLSIHLPCFCSMCLPPVPQPQAGAHVCALLRVRAAVSAGGACVC